MTAGTLEKVWRLNDPRLTPAAKSVLSYLAYRAYYADGRAAWPSVDTVSRATGCSRATVHRAVSMLVELGYLRAADDQSWNARNAVTGEPVRRNYRTTVWDVLTENFRDVESESAERIADQTMDAGSSTDIQGSQNETPGMEPVQGSQIETPESRGLILHDEGSHDETQLTKDQQDYPSAPSGHLPADGESHDDDPGEVADADAVRVVDELVRRRRLLGVSSPEPRRRDFAAVRGLLARLSADGVADPVARVLSVLGFAMRGDWWPKRIRSGRNLAALFDQVVDDMRLAGVAARETVSDEDAGHVHSVSCRHVAGVVDSPAARAAQPLSGRRWEHAGLVARLLNEGAGPEDAAGRLADLLHEAERRREEDLAELARLREERGGSMFAGHGKVESEVAA